MIRCLLLGIAVTFQSGANLAFSSESIMFSHEWNALPVGQPVVDGRLNRFYVTATEPSSDGGASSLLLANDAVAFWTRNHAGFRKAPLEDPAPLDLRQVVSGERYWIATAASPLPKRAWCRRLTRSNSGWVLESGDSRIKEEEILAIFPDGFDGYHQASLLLISHIEEALDQMLDGCNE